MGITVSKKNVCDVSTCHKKKSKKTPHYKRRYCTNHNCAISECGEKIVNGNRCCFYHKCLSCDKGNYVGGYCPDCWLKLLHSKNTVK